MTVVAVVPMKLVNRRLPGKNTMRFTGGEPLCTYILKTLLNVKELDRICVYCSDEAIIDYLPSGVDFVQRPESFDTDTSGMNEILKAFAEEVVADIYLMTHATAPFISPDSIRRGIEAVAHEGYDSSFSAKKLQDFLWKDGIPLNYNPNNIPRTQDLDPIFVETSGFYAYKREVIASGRRVGDLPLIVEVDEIEAMDIDEAEDFKIADAIFQVLRADHLNGKEGAR